MGNDAERYRALKAAAKQVYMYPNSELDNRMVWKFPVLIAMTCINTEVSLDDAVDAFMQRGLRGRSVDA